MKVVDWKSLCKVCVSTERKAAKLRRLKCLLHCAVSKLTLSMMWHRTVSPP